jgi:Ca-activated chloride channel homolog
VSGCSQRPYCSAGQSTPPGNHTANATFKSKVDLVLVPTVVTDSADRLVTGLDKDNFEVFQDKYPQTISHLSSEDAPVSVGIVLDASGSMKDKVDKAFEAVKTFLDDANPQDEAFLVTVANKPEMAAGFTHHLADIENKLVFTRAQGQTALLDAIYFSVSEMRNARQKRKALLIISDGGGNHSRYTEREVKLLVEEADVQIFAVGLYDQFPRTMEEREGPNLLSQIADVTGGRAFELDDPNDLADVVTKIGLALRNEYVLAYRPKPKPHDGRWHKIRVKLLPPKGLARLFVASKQGYYASTE